MKGFVGAQHRGTSPTPRLVVAHPALSIANTNSNKPQIPKASCSAVLDSPLGVCCATQPEGVFLAESVSGSDGCTTPVDWVVTPLLTHAQRIDSEHSCGAVSQHTGRCRPVCIDVPSPECIGEEVCPPEIQLFQYRSPTLHHRTPVPGLVLPH